MVVGGGAEMNMKEEGAGRRRKKIRWRERKNGLLDLDPMLSVTSGKINDEATTRRALSV